MSKKVIFIVVLLAFVGLFIRGSLPGADPYYFLTFKGQPQPKMPSLFFHLMGLLPTGFEWVILPAMGILLVFTLTKLTKNPVAVLLCFAAPAFVFRLNFLEDDFLGLCFAYAGLYYYYKGNFWQTLMFFFLTFATWRGAALFLIFILGDFAIKHKQTVLGYGLWAMTFIYFATTINWFVGEHTLGALLFVFNVALLMVGLREYKNVEPKFQRMTVYFVGLGLVLAKFIWLSVLPLAILTSLFVEKDKRGLYFLVGALTFGLLIGNNAVIHAVPNSLEDLRDVVSITGGAGIANDWSLGHYLTYLNGNPLFTPLNPQQHFSIPPEAKYALTNETLSLPVVKRYEEFTLYSVV